MNACLTWPTKTSQSRILMTGFHRSIYVACTAIIEYKCPIYTILAFDIISPMHNTTVALGALTTTPFTLFTLLKTSCTAVLSKIPFSFSYVQQVHVKLKAETVVMFVFYFVKQVYAYGKSWHAKREGERLRQARNVARKEKKKKKGKRYKKQMAK